MTRLLAFGLDWQLAFKFNESSIRKFAYVLGMPLEEKAQWLILINQYSDVRLFVSASCGLFSVPSGAANPAQHP